MAATTEQVVIEFVPDFTQLENSFEKFAASGDLDKQLANKFLNLVKAIQEGSESVSELKKQYEDLKNTASKMGDSVKKSFEEGVNDALKRAGISMEEFLALLEKGVPPATKHISTLKSELKELTAQIQRAKDAGSPIDPSLVERAGKLSAAIKNASKEIAHAGSDTKNLDTVIGSLGAVASGFSAAQGAAVLFGDANEDVTKGLLKLNAGMAVANGLAQISNAMQKEGSLTRLADVIATKAQSAAQIAYNIVVGESVGVLLAFRLALAATGVGVFILLIGQLIQAMNSANDEIDDANTGLESENRLLEMNNKSIERNTKLQLARSKAAGKAESEQMRITGQSINAQIDALDEQTARLEQERDAVGMTSAAWNKYNEQIAKNVEARKDLVAEAQAQKIELDAKVAEEQADAAKKAREKAQEALEQRDKDAIASLERQLLAEDLFVTKRLDLEKKLVDAKKKLELDSEKHTLQEIWLLEVQAATDKLKLTRDANEEAQKMLTGAGATKAINDRNEKIDEGNKEVAKKQEDYIKRAVPAQLEMLGKMIKLNQDTNKKKLEDDIKADEERKKRFKKNFEAAAEGASAILDFFNTLGQQQDEAAQNRIENERKHVDELLQAGAITEKDAKDRQKRLDAEEARMKRAAAKREKEMAIFQAIINTAVAVTKASPNPVEIALAIALGAAQVALIASKPIPKFASGKHGTFKGLGIVGEAGAELVEQDGRLVLVTKPTKVYLSEQDKVFTHGETKRILQNIDASLYKHSANGNAIDYDRLGESIARNTKGVSININKDFISEAVADGLAYKKYFNKRYSSK